MGANQVLRGRDFETKLKQVQGCPQRDLNSCRRREGAEKTKKKDNK